MPFGAASSPFLLSATLHHHFENTTGEHEEMTSGLKHQFYVDDIVAEADTAEAALLVCNNAPNVINEAEMHLRKWTTNSTSLQHLSEEREGINKDIRLTVPKNKKLLGVL